MLFQLFVLVVALVATGLGAAIPVVEEIGSKDSSVFSNKKTLEKREYTIFWDIWTNQNAPPSYPSDTDDAWAEVKLKFPMKLFDTVSSTAYISMNGFLTLDKPAGPKLPGNNRPLPVNPTDCGSSATGLGCMPKTIVAPMWQDLWIATSSDNLLFVSMQYQSPNSTTTAGASYSFLWRVCRKNSSKTVASANVAQCNDNKNVFIVILSYKENQPGIWNFNYIGNDADKLPATVGVQSFPNCSQRTYPPLQ
ncbi:hypothetical protein TWF696_001794 [Orbilia brochopaga]|uniref:Uncharacterized protein n=1 Tax=Orbilia brochopaga TaxID=3140254 RepID=A0AAV9U9C5_9PEZI